MEPDTTHAGSHVGSVLAELYDNLDPVGKALFIEVFTKEGEDELD
jgi:hypothetical protein